MQALEAIASFGAINTKLQQLSLTQKLQRFMQITFQMTLLLLRTRISTCSTISTSLISFGRHRHVSHTAALDKTLVFDLGEFNQSMLT
jgi:hypothetical protein